MLMISCLCDWKTKKNIYKIMLSQVLYFAKLILLHNSLVKQILRHQNSIYLREIQRSLNIAHRTISLFAYFHDSYSVIREQTDQEGSASNTVSANYGPTHFVKPFKICGKQSFCCVTQ